MPLEVKLFLIMIGLFGTMCAMALWMVYLESRS